MKPEILTGIINHRYFVVSIFDDRDAIKPMMKGLELFFEAYDKSKIQQRLKKESEHGYFSMSTVDSSKEEGM